MKVEFRRLSIALIILYALSMIFTAYVLFQLQDELIYKSQVLSVEDMSAAAPVFVKAYLVVGITLLIGLGALVLSLNKKSAEVIYVEKKKSSTTTHQQHEEEEGSHTLDMNAIKEIAARESDENIMTKEILKYTCKHLEAGIGAFYKASKENNKRVLEMTASYALALGESQTIKFEFGEGLVGQAALEEKTLIIDEIPEGYIKIVSGLGSATPTHLLIVPVKNGSTLHGVVEVASFTNLGKNDAEMVGAAFRQVTQKLFGASKAQTAEKNLKEEDTRAEEPQEKKEKKTRSTKKGSNKA